MYRQTLKGIQAAAEAGFHPIKINAVAINGFNNDELEDFGRWAKETGYIVRFIEYMPLDAHQKWEMKKVLPAKKILDGLSRAGELELARDNPHDPATKYRYKDGKGEVGVIPTVTWLAEVVLTKTPGHLIGQKEFVQPARGMSAIGG
jgi:cyclic pyranopterin phosphate synthase